MKPPDCRYCGTSVRGPIRQQQAKNDHHAPIWWCPECERELGNPDLETSKSGIEVGRTKQNLIAINAMKNGDIMTFLLKPEHTDQLVRTLQSETYKAKEENHG